MIIKKLVKKFLAFYGTRRFITVFTKLATDPHPGAPSSLSAPYAYVSHKRSLPSTFPFRLKICVPSSFLPYVLHVPFVSSLLILFALQCSADLYVISPIPPLPNVAIEWVALLPFILEIAGYLGL
jgi:hypothetical protein